MVYLLEILLIETNFIFFWSFFPTVDPFATNSQHCTTKNSFQESKVFLHFHGHIFHFTKILIIQLGQLFWLINLSTTYIKCENKNFKAEARTILTILLFGKIEKQKLTSHFYSVIQHFLKLEHSQDWNVKTNLPQGCLNYGEAM